MVEVSRKIFWKGVEIGLRLLPIRLFLYFAQGLVEHRPIDSYPGWHFGIAEENPDVKTKLRLIIWDVAKEQNIEQPMLFQWDHGLKLHMYLGNDQSRCLYVGGCIEPNELNLLTRILEPGMTFVDAGANEGLFSLLAARLVGSDGHVIAVEPSPRELRRLKSNIELNKMDNVTVIEVALSDRCGRTELRIADDEHSGQNTMGDFVWEGLTLAGVETVKTKTLDQMVAEMQLSRVDVVKMDIEGAEHEALVGSSRALNEFRPLIIMELLDSALRQQGSSGNTVLDLLESQGYLI